MSCRYKTFDDAGVSPLCNTEVSEYNSKGGIDSDGMGVEDLGCCPGVALSGAALAPLTEGVLPVGRGGLFAFLGGRGAAIRALEPRRRSVPALAGDHPRGGCGSGLAQAWPP